MSKKEVEEVLDEGEPILANKVKKRIEEELPSVVKQIKEGIEDRIDAETIGIEFLKELEPIIESRRKLKEAEESLSTTILALKMAIEDLTLKFESFTELKMVNLNLEREVLTDIKAKLNRKP